MTELQRITSNNNGEKPSTGEYTIFTIEQIDNPYEILENCKKIVSVLLTHKELKPDSEKWKSLLPDRVVKFINQLDDLDYGNDEYLFSIPSIVSSFQNSKIRKWEWYSSKLTESGFEITFNGWCSFKNYWMIHCQMVPYSKFHIEELESMFQPRVYKDVITYKEFTL